jgi:hypothetical protein
MFELIKENIYIKKLELIISQIELSAPSIYNKKDISPEIKIDSKNNYTLNGGFFILNLSTKNKNINLKLLVDYVVFLLDHKTSLFFLSMYTFLGNLIGATFPSYNITISVIKTDNDEKTEVYKSHKILEYLKHYFNNDEDFEKLINKLNTKYGNA